MYGFNIFFFYKNNKHKTKANFTIASLVLRKKNAFYKQV